MITIDALVLDHLQVHDHVILLALDIVTAIENTIQSELYHAQDAMKLANCEFLDLNIIPSSDRVVTKIVLDVTLKMAVF